MREVAHRAGINVSTVSRIESGALDPSVGVLDKLLAAYGQRLEVVPMIVASPERPVQLRPGRVLSPLRYPGAKRLLLPVIRDLLPERVDLLVEPFAGGASVSLALLDEGRAGRVVLGDADPLVSAFWSVAVHRSDQLIERMRDEPVTLDRWDYWRACEPSDQLGMALKCLFLNRTSFSGVMHGGAGPIGGRGQKGAYAIDCRFGRDDLEKRIRYVAELGAGGRIEVVAGGWRQTVAHAAAASSAVVYLDPPYIEKSEALYGVPFSVDDHQQLADHLVGASHDWLLSYDDHPTVRRLYGSAPGLGRYIVDHRYSTAGTRSRATHRSELLIANRRVPACPLARWSNTGGA